MSASLFRKTRSPKPTNGEHHPVTAAQCRRGMLFGVLCTAFGLLGIALGMRGTPTQSNAWQQLTMSFIVLPLLMPYFHWQGLLRRMRRGERFETVYFAPSLEQAREQATRMRVVAMIFAVVGALAMPLFLFWGTQRGIVVPMLLTVAASWYVGACVFRRADSESLKLRSQIQAASPTTAVTATAFAIAPASRVGHWWTDTQAREENKIVVRR